MIAACEKERELKDALVLDIMRHLEVLIKELVGGAGSLQSFMDSPVLHVASAHAQRCSYIENADELTAVCAAFEARTAEKPSQYPTAAHRVLPRCLSALLTILTTNLLCAVTACITHPISDCPHPLCAWPQSAGVCKCLHSRPLRVGSTTRGHLASEHAGTCANST